MVRGSALRVTGLTRQGAVPSTVTYATSRSVTRVAILETPEVGASEGLRNAEDERRLLFVDPSVTIRYDVEMEFIRCDPGILGLITGALQVKSEDGDGGFGFGPFGLTPFGSGSSEGSGFGFGGFGEGPFGIGGTSDGTVKGFDVNPHIEPTSFALEVWTKLDASKCEGQRRYGYTVFPHLYGGRLTGVLFHNGLVSFKILGASTRRSRWGHGPYDIDGPGNRLHTPLTPRTAFRTQIVSSPPPEQIDGTSQFVWVA